MGSWLLVLFVLLAFVGVLLFRRRERRLYPDPETADELHWVRTSDGIRVALYRYRPRIQGRGEPVLCVHGLGANHLNLAFNEEAGLAQYLANRGYDVFAVDLRGRGMSDFPEKSWGFDDYVQKDLPAVVTHILKVTGFDRLHWVGHSMGGMLFYAFCGSTPYSSAIASAVTLGSPVRFYHPRSLERFGVRFYPYLRIFRYLNLRKVIPFLFFFLARSPRVRVFYNPENVRPDLIRWAGRYALGTLAVTELYQFARWIVEHHLRSLDDRWDYREGIRKISIPTLVIAGAGDLLCPAYTVRPAYESLSAPAKAYVEAGVAQGFLRDYGHIDLAFGIHARREIFPLVAEWIRRNAIEKHQRLAVPL